MSNLLCFLSILLPLSLYSEIILVTAEKIPSSKENTSNQVFILDENDLKDKKNNLLWEELEKIPGLSISNNGGVGQTTTVSMRGAESRHTLVLFEGIELNDASTTSNLADLSIMTLNQIKRIEVLPGSQSVLYGSDAIGGVLRTELIELDKINRPLFEFNGGYGSNKSLALGISQSNKIKKLSYVLNLSQMGTDGISQTRVGNNERSENDSSYIGTANAKVQFRLSDYQKFTFLTQLSSSKTQIDKGFGSERDDTNNETKSRNLLYKVESESLLLEGKLESVISFSSINNLREDKDETDSLSSSISTFMSKFERNKIYNQNIFYFTNQDLLLFGLEYEKETGQTESFSNNTTGGLNKTTEENQSFFLNYKREDILFLSIGSRFQQFEDDSSVNYKFSPGVKFNKNKVWFSLSTGFKNPSLFQKNSSQYGNTYLNPEKSISYELGLSLFESSDIHLDLVLYYLKIKDLIDTEGVYPNLRYINIDKTESKGLSLSSKFVIGGISINYLDGEDQDGKKLINRSKLSSNAYLEKVFLESYKIKLEGTYNGPKDSGSVFSRISLGGYTLFNSSLSFEYKKTLTLWLKINNLLDKEYTEIAEYNTDGQNFNLGFNWRY